MKKRKERVSSESTLPLVVGITAEESTALIPAASESKAQKDLTPVGRDALSRIRGRDFDSACGLTEDTGALIVWQAPPILEEMAAHNQLDSKQDPDSFRPPATSDIEYQRQGPTAQMTNISFMVGNSSHARPTDQDDENLRGDVLTLINELEDERAAALERTRILEERLQQELENERTAAAERTTILKSKEAAIERTRVLDENLELAPQSAEENFGPQSARSRSLSLQEAKKHLSEMVNSKSLTTKIDRPMGVVSFRVVQDCNGTLNSWATNLEQLSVSIGRP
ncbi:26S proteasome non-ATPase regulatory subunit 12 B [Zea mays]|uniref:26S proteasome non-ATPase regulatory subunit 12 B n=1 Tax=Zea mays TaxID=4577 RepID=A0A317YJP9_MAIZE|nr:26S proteasome non-ATPase regulatory subunit 12 B [Zea mays]